MQQVSFFLVVPRFHRVRQVSRTHATLCTHAHIPDRMEMESKEQITQRADSNLIETNSIKKQ